MIQFPVVFTALLFTLTISGQTVAQINSQTNYLQECLEKQLTPLGNNFLQFFYQEAEKKLYHSPEPWQTGGYERRGTICCGQELYFRDDTASLGGKDYVSRVEYSPDALLIRGSRDDKIRNVAESKFSTYPLVVTRYTPTLLLNLARIAQPEVDVESDTQYALYNFTVNNYTVRLSIRKSDYLLDKVSFIWHDDMLGDMTETTSYSDFVLQEGLYVPQSIRIEKIHDIEEVIEIRANGIVGGITPLLEKPEGYTIEPDETVTPEIYHEKLSDHIHLLNLPHTESRAVAVEFRDFFAVIDVPFSSENGEMVLGELRRIAPNKPVRYFTFGHHHPWYLGGVRPFIYRGATVLTTEESMDYLRYLATAPHTLAPDSLHLYPKELRTELVDSVMTITDGEYTMTLCHIGMRSKHTTDYTIFYFPEEKIVMHGDLAWIPADKPIKGGGVREKGLYDAIEEFGLDVETVIQTWPVGDNYNIKNIYPITDLEAAASAE